MELGKPLPFFIEGEPVKKKKKENPAHLYCDKLLRAAGSSFSYAEAVFLVGPCAWLMEKRISPTIGQEVATIFRYRDEIYSCCSVLAGINQEQWKRNSTRLITVSPFGGQRMDTFFFIILRRQTSLSQGTLDLKERYTCILHYQGLLALNENCCMY